MGTLQLKILNVEFTKWIFWIFIWTPGKGTLPSTADLGALSQGDDLLQNMALKMGATDTEGWSEHTWRAKIGQQTTKAKSCYLPSNLLSRSHLDAIALRKRPRIQRRNEQQKPLDTKKMYRLFHSKRHLLYCRDNFSSRNISNKTLLLHPKFTNNEGQIITHSLRGVLMKSKGALELTGRVAIWVVKTRPCADDPPFQLLSWQYHKLAESSLD